MLKLIKIIISLILSTIFVLAIALSIYFHWEQNLTTLTAGLLVFLIIFNAIMLWYVNWAIWTKGKAKKVIMMIVIISILLLLSIILAYE